MRRFFVFLLLAAMCLPTTFATAKPFSFAPTAMQDNDSQERRTLRVPQRRRRVRGEGRRGSNRGIGSAYSRAGRSAARGASGFGRNIARGKPIVAGRRLGRGMGGFGKHTGIGTARVGKKVGRTTRRVFTGR
ncbi:MAG: hypothetical protein H0T45_12230 [Pyrinomonadaceae bacterium]|nr:hypothetical protein [Pyrinomonadaceae bacterium]